MTPKKFPGTNAVLGGGGFRDLPAIATDDGDFIHCWEFSDEEWGEMSKNRCIYIHQRTFNKGFNPILPMASLEDGMQIT